MNKETVLIVDDDEIQLLIFQNALELEGFNVVVTTSGLEARQMFLNHQPQVVILDVFMPDRDGFEVIKELRALSEDVFIIAVSANDRYLPAIKALGANLTLAKSAMPDVMVAAIKNRAQ